MRPGGIEPSSPEPESNVISITLRAHQLYNYSTDSDASAS